MSYQLEFCKKCVNKSFSSSQGIVCGLTDEKPTFVNTCPDFVRDVEAEKRMEDRKAVMEDSADFTDESGNSISPWRIVWTVLLLIVIIARVAIRCSN